MVIERVVIYGMKTYGSFSRLLQVLLQIPKYRLGKIFSTKGQIKYIIVIILYPSLQFRFVFKQMIGYQLVAILKEIL